MRKATGSTPKLARLALWLLAVSATTIKASQYVAHALAAPVTQPVTPLSDSGYTYSEGIGFLLSFMLAGILQLAGYLWQNWLEAIIILYVFVETRFAFREIKEKIITR